MATDSLAIARMLVDIAVPRASVVRVVSGLTPAKIVEVVDRLNVVEMMMALQKMRARRTPSNQAHVTNKRENPALLACDAAEAVERGFSELETTWVGGMRRQRHGHPHRLPDRPRRANPVCSGRSYGPAAAAQS
jgi:propanediol dehydratase large subunit